MAGRIEAAVRYSDAGQTVLGTSHDALPYGIEGWLRLCIRVHRPARTVRSSGAAPSSHAVATPSIIQGIAGFRTRDGRFTVRRRWPPRMA